MTTSRREILKAIPAAVLAASAAVPAGAIPPVARGGKPRLRLGLAGYSLRDHLTGKLSPAIVRAVRSDWFGVNLDTGNFHGVDPYADLARCVPYAVTAQLKVEMQAKGGPKQEADFGRLVRMLKDGGYRGYATLEYEGAEPPLTAVPRTLDRLRALL